MKNRHYNVAYLLVLWAFLPLGHTATGQNLLFESIEETPTKYNSGALVSRMVEGLGFRYYWATKGLTKDDLDFQPSEDNRNIQETIEHLFNLSEFMVSPLEQKTVTRSDPSLLTFDSLRTSTLINFEKAVKILNESDDQSFKDYNIKFDNGATLPFWYVINGPLADAIYHTGQVVMMRRMSGNPIDPEVNVLMGKKQD